MFDFETPQFPLQDALQKAKEKKGQQDLERNTNVLLDVSEDVQEIVSDLVRQTKATEELLSKQTAALNKLKTAVQYFESSGGNFLPLSKAIDSVVEKDIFDNVVRLNAQRYLKAMNLNVPSSDSPLWKIDGEQ